MARGDKPVIRKEARTPPEHGTLKGGHLKDAVLMFHPDGEDIADGQGGFRPQLGKGLRYIPKSEVEKKKKRGYVLVDEVKAPPRTPINPVKGKK